MSPTKKATLGAGLIGIALPILILVMDGLSLHGWWPRWTLYVWPTSFMLVGASGARGVGEYLLIGASIAINGILYGYLGSLLYRLARRQREKV